MHIVLFGGAFDPPHLGHINVVDNFVKLGLADQIIFLPTFDHNFDKKMIDPQKRLEMLELVREIHFANLPVYVSDYEITKLGKSLTYDTLSDLSSQNPHHQYSFLIGSDNLASFHKWASYQKLLDQYKFFVYPREGFTFDNLREGMIPLYDLPEMKVSSTLVKTNLENNLKVDDLLSPEIVNYIKENNLY